MTNRALLEQILAEVTSQGTRIAKLENEVFNGGKVSKVEKQTKSAKKSTAKKSAKQKAPTQAQLDARKAWGEAQHAKAEARKELFNIVNTPEYQAEWGAWKNSDMYEAATRAERKELNKKMHAIIVAKLAK